jgi:hypothetical protein
MELGFNYPVVKMKPVFPVEILCSGIKCGRDAQKCFSFT